MDIYRLAWASAWLAAGVVPVFFGLMVASLFALGTAALFTAACFAVAADWAPMDCAAAGVLAATVVAALWWAGPTALAATGLMGVSSPRVVAWVARVARPVHHVGDTSDASDVEALDDSRLCAAWSESYVALRRAEDPAERLAIVNARQAYLDELEARDATGFRTWLRSAARPVGNPHPFIDPK